MKPSLLLGDRKEFRLGERIFQILMKPLGFIIPKKWRAVHDWQVASAMVDAAMNPPNGVQFISNDLICTIKN
jgi:hypothetical protein